MCYFCKAGGREEGAMVVLETMTVRESRLDDSSESEVWCNTGRPR